MQLQKLMHVRMFKCLLTNFVCIATVITSKKSKQYVGSSGWSFTVKRHKYSFYNIKYRLKTTLFKYIRNYKDINKHFSFNCKVFARTKNKFNLKLGCTLRIIKKHEISKLNSNLTFKIQNDFFGNCKHFFKALL